MVRDYLYAILAAIVILCIAAGSGMAAENGKTTERVIYTSATGEVATQPDLVMISVSVDTEHQDAKVAQMQNAQAMSGIIDALVGTGIERRDLQTTGYSIYPVYDESTPLRLKVKLYRVSNTLQIRLRDVARAGEILDLAVQHGANRINYISFQLSEEKQQELRSLALREAVAKTRLDADAVAEAAGLRISGIKEINIGAYYAPVSAYAYKDLRAEGAYSTPVESGEVKVTAQVSVTYLC